MNGVDGGNPTRLTLVWLSLLVLSGASALATLAMQLSWPTVGVVLVLGLAFFKVCLVARDFMGLRGRGRATMRRALLCWCLVLVVGALARTVVAAVAEG